jgi:PAS domain S-box-containing protein
MGIGKDITERKRMEKALRDSEIKYRDLFEHTLLGMEVIDGNTGRVLLSNHSMARMFGFKSPQDMVGTNPMDYVPSEDLEWVISQLAQVMADPEKRDVATLRASTEDGRMLWVTGSTTSFEYEGKPAALISLIDVTVAKEAQDKLRESEILYRSILNNMIDVYYRTDKDGNIILNSPSGVALLGYGSVEDGLGRNAAEFYYNPEDRKKFLAELRKNGYVKDYEIILKHRDGTPMPVSASSRYYYNEKGEVLGIEGIYRDIRERKRMEETLLRISKAVESSSDAIGMSDAQGHHFYHNQAFTDLFEYTPEELEAAGGGPAAFENRNVARKVFDTIKGGGSWSGEVEMVSKSGRKFLVLERADAIKDESGKVIGLVGVHTDITVRKKAEEQLRETRDYMENLIEHANVPMVVWTPDFRITRFNRAFERLTGMKAQSVIGKELEILFPRETREKSMSFMRTALKGARWEVVEMPVLNVQGNVRTVLWNISTIYAEDKKTPTAIIAQGQDITERKQAEEALRESEEMSRSMLDNAAMGIYLLQNKKFLYVNPTFEKIMGYTSAELVGQEAINYVHPSDRGIVRIRAVENLKGVSTLPYEFRALRKDGKQIWVMERVTSIRHKRKRSVIASFMETTEHRKAEEQLERAYEELKTAHERMVQSEKLRAMGEMASGIAHDFNNMLAVILGRTQLVIDDVKDDKVKKGIQIIEQAALDAAKTVKRLQDFARIRVEHPFESLEVNQVVEGVLKMVEPRVIELEQTKGITIKVAQELGKVGQISGDAAELREALLNILFNAMDAMPTGGKLTVKSQQDEDWVQILITDTGVGIPDKIKSRVFEPFFTTKASKGSGLGLSVTYGIIARHGGMLKFDSAVGKGTTFYIRLPLAVEAMKKEIKKGKAVAAKAANILTVDDESEVLQALGLTLEYFGHWVKGYTSGAEAVKAFKDGNYDLVITDLGMPGMSGWDVARAIKKIKPDMPVLLITGWVIDLDEEQKKLVDGVIAKPFSRDSISSSISQVFPAKKKRATKKKSE